MSMRIFDKVEVKKPSRNVFDLTHERKFSTKMGKMTPIFCTDVVPGDELILSTQYVMRLAPLLAPIMHKINVYTHYFFVPNRLVWDGWEEFITNGNGVDPLPVHPYLNVTTSKENKIGSLADYLGVSPTTFSNVTSENPIKINPFAMAAYNKIYNDWYRDQNLQDELPEQLVDGNNNATFLNGDGNDVFEIDSVRYRNWEHDYLTSALPWTQKGDDVMLAIDSEGNIPVEFNYNNPDTWHGSHGNPYELTAVEVKVGGEDAQMYADPSGSLDPLAVDNSDNLSVDLSGTNLITVNQFRVAMRLQEWLELNARGGSRYIETILAHFGVRSSDARLQNPEFLGGGRSPFLISEVVQVSESSTSGTPQGTMAGHGISADQTHQFKRRFEEHGYVIGIMTIMPKSAYMQGIPRHFLRQDNLDYYWRSFANLGEQAIFNAEVVGNHNDPYGEFGYIPRYSEYKYINDSVHGDFVNTLKFWHMAREFSESSLPTLNSDFVTCQPTQRIFSVEGVEDNVWCYILNRCKAIRPMPYFGTPTI